MASAQTLNGLSVKDSAGTITVTPGAGGATLDLRGAGAALISRTGLGVLNVTALAAGAAVKTANANVAGSLGGYITVGVTGTVGDWAKNDGAGNLVALAAGDYVTSAPSLAGPVANLRVDATTDVSVSTNINSLKLNVATGTGNLTFTAGTTLTIDTGGILSANTANIGTVANQGSITSGNGTDLIFHGANNSTVNAVVADNGATPIEITVSKSAGTLTLAAANIHSGPLTVHQGAVIASNANALQNFQIQAQATATSAAIPPPPPPSQAGFHSVAAICPTIAV